MSNSPTARIALALVTALTSGATLAASAAPAAAQYNPQFDGRFDYGQYRVWRAEWDQNQFDRRHVILGVVSEFQPYRLSIRHPDGYVQTIDLNGGSHATIILPTGGTPQVNQHVAVIGHWSKGTFIANRVILRA